MVVTKMLRVIWTVKFQAEEISDGEEELSGNSSSHFCYALAKNLPGLFSSRDLWNFELERDDLEYPVKKISKQQNIQVNSLTASNNICSYA